MHPSLTQADIDRATEFALHRTERYLRQRRIRDAEGDDYRSAALLGVAEAALTYDPSRSAFQTFAYRCVRSAWDEQERLLRPRGRRTTQWRYQRLEPLSFDDLMDEEQAFAALVADPAPGPEAEVLALLLWDDLVAALDRLPRQQRLALAMRLDGAGTAAVQAATGLTRSRAEFYVATGRETLRRALVGAGWLEG